MIIKTKHHTVQLNSDNTIESDGQYNIEFINGEFKTIRINGFDLITCFEKYGGLFLHHLDVPEKNKGFGELGLAIFYALCKKFNYSNFSIKFGGGEKSKNFLTHLGFSDNQIALVQDTDYVQLSVIVGDIQKEGDGVRDWVLNHQNINEYPTNFFTISN